MVVADNPYHDPMGSPERRSRYEYQLARDFLWPLLDRWGIDVRGKRVLDLGCGTGGLSVALAEMGAYCRGLDCNEERISKAREMAVRHDVRPQFQVADVLDLDNPEELFDLVILSEVLEHLGNLSNVATLLDWCRKHLARGGRLYVSFPPWLHPFGGHQAGWPAIRRIPWYHLLPDLFKRLLVPEHAPRYIEWTRGELNHLTISTFEQIAKQVGLTIVQQELYHIRPEYYWRYGVPVVRSSPLLAKTRVVREITTTGAFYLLKAHAE